MTDDDPREMLRTAMTQPRSACCVCFRSFPEIGQRKCPGCLGRLVPNNTVTKHPTPTPSQLPTNDTVGRYEVSDTVDANDADKQAWHRAAAKAASEGLPEIGVGRRAYTGLPPLKWPGPEVTEIPRTPATRHTRHRVTARPEVRRAFRTPPANIGQSPAKPGSAGSDQPSPTTPANPTGRSPNTTVTTTLPQLRGPILRGGFRSLQPVTIRDPTRRKYLPPENTDRENSSISANWQTHPAKLGVRNG